jgi:hypothetical protein
LTDGLSSISIGEHRQPLVDLAQSPPDIPLPSAPDAIAANVSVASERSTKDDPSAAIEISTSHIRPHAPAAALRQGILERELQLFDAALMKTFPNISSSAAAIIIKNATRQIGVPGSIIFREGDISSDMLFLCSGCLDVQKRGVNAAKIDCNTIVGHHAYLYHRPRSATVVVTRGPQCIYYVFSIDRLSADAEIKSGLWHATTARIIAAKDNKSDAAAAGVAPKDDPDLVVVEEDIGHFSPQSKRRMSMLLGEEAAARRYSRDFLDYGLIQPALPSMQSPQSSSASVNPQFPSDLQQTLDFTASPRQRPTSARNVSSSRVGTSPLRSLSSRSKASPTSSSGVVREQVDISDLMSPRRVATASAVSRSGLSAKSPRRSIVGRSKDAVQQQLSNSSTGSVSCIIFSAAWLLFLTQLEKTRMSGQRHALCRCCARQTAAICC